MDSGTLYKEQYMSWEYICAQRDDAVKHNDIYYTLQQLVEQYSGQSGVKFDEKNGAITLYSYYSAFCVKTLDGQCSTMIAYSFSISPDRRVDFLSKCLPLLDFLAKAGGYSQIMVSNISGSPITNFFRENGYRCINTVYNRRTGSTIEILVKDVSN